VPDDALVGRGLRDALEYQRRKPEETVLYRAVQENLETFLASARDQGRVVPRFGEEHRDSRGPRPAAPRVRHRTAAR
jgi:hypothetical protein